MRAGRKALSTLAQGRGVEDIEGLFGPHTEKREGVSTSNLDLGSVGSCKFQLSPRLSLISPLRYLPRGCVISSKTGYAA